MDRPERWHARRDATVSRAVSEWRRRWPGAGPARPLAAPAPLLIFQLPAASGARTHHARTARRASRGGTVRRCGGRGADEDEEGVEATAAWRSPRTRRREARGGCGRGVGGGRGAPLCCRGATYEGVVGKGLLIFDGCTNTTKGSSLKLIRTVNSI